MKNDLAKARIPVVPGIMSLYRGSFNVSIELDEASCAGQEVSSGVSPRAE